MNKLKVTEGEWVVDKVSDESIFISSKTSFDSITSSRAIARVLDINDAHLLAKSKAMYELLNKLSGFNCPVEYMGDEEFELFDCIDNLLAQCRGGDVE